MLFYSFQRSRLYFTMLVSALFCCLPHLALPVRRLLLKQSYQYIRFLLFLQVSAYMADHFTLSAIHICTQLAYHQLPLLQYHCSQLRRPQFIPNPRPPTRIPAVRALQVWSTTTLGLILANIYMDANFQLHANACYASPL